MAGVGGWILIAVGDKAPAGFAAKAARLKLQMHFVEPGGSYSQGKFRYLIVLDIEKIDGWGRRIRTSA